MGRNSKKTENQATSKHSKGLQEFFSFLAHMKAHEKWYIPILILSIVPKLYPNGPAAFCQGHVRYLPLNGPTKKNKKPPPGQPDSPPSPTTPMATSTPTATRTLNRTITTPHHLRDYVHGADLDLDSLGLLPIADYNQTDLSDLLSNSSPIIQEHIQIQEEETRARDARDQKRIQKRLARDHHNRED
jgi:hypothetical protein